VSVYFQHQPSNSSSFQQPNQQMNRRQPNEDKGGPVGTAALPPHLLRLFAPRPALPYAEPLDKAPGHAKGNHLTPVSQFLDIMKGHDTDYVPTLSIAERKKQKVQSCPNGLFAMCQSNNLPLALLERYEKPVYLQVFRFSS